MEILSRRHNPGKIAFNIVSGNPLSWHILATEWNIPGPPEKCTLNLTILSGSKFGLLEGHSRSSRKYTIIGLVKLRQDDTHNKLITRADAALYRAKKNGRYRAVAQQADGDMVF